MKNDEKSNKELLKEISVLKLQLSKQTQEIQHFVNIIQKANDAIMVVKQGLIVFVNEYLCKITGFTQKELIGQRFLLFVEEDTRAMVKGFYTKEQEEGASENIYNSGIIIKNKSILKVEVTTSAINFEGAESVLSII